MRIRSILAMAVIAVIMTATAAFAYPSIVYDSGTNSCNSPNRLVVSAYSYDYAQAQKEGGTWYTNNPSGESWHRTHTKIWTASATWVARGPGLSEIKTYSICQAY